MHLKVKGEGAGSTNIVARSAIQRRHFSPKYFVWEDTTMIIHTKAVCWQQWRVVHCFTAIG